MRESDLLDHYTKLDLTERNEVLFTRILGRETILCIDGEVWSNYYTLQELADEAKNVYLNVTPDDHIEVLDINIIDNEITLYDSSDNTLSKCCVIDLVVRAMTWSSATINKDHTLYVCDTTNEDRKITDDKSF